MNNPKRIQKHAGDWTLPDNTVDVACPSIWGNPFFAGNAHPLDSAAMSKVEAYNLYIDYTLKYNHKTGTLSDFYKDEIMIKNIQDDLAGKDLACYCEIGDLCHADFLLKIANDKF